jgi:hypothetical protein
VTASGSFISRRAFAGSAALLAAAAGGAGRASAGTSGGAGRAPLTNVRVSDDRFAAHIEPSVAANPRDQRNLLAACRVFQGTRIGMATYVSFDGGQAWRGNGLLPGLVPDFDGNAVVAFDERGSGFVCGIEATAAQPRRGDARIWRTVDGGRSFGPAVTAIGGGGGLVDHPGLAIDRRAGPRSGRLYIAAVLAGGMSGPGQARFAAPRRVTTQSFDPALAIDTGSTRWLGNYQGLTATSGVFQPVWTDTRTGTAQIFTASVPA